MAVDAFKLRVSGDKAPVYLRPNQGKVVLAQLTTGAKFIKLPRRMVRATAVVSLEQVRVEPDLLPTEPNPARVPSPAPFARVRVRLEDGSYFENSEGKLKNQRINHYVDTVEAFPAHDETGEPTEAYGKTLKSVFVSYDSEGYEVAKVVNS